MSSHNISNNGNPNEFSNKVLRGKKRRKKSTLHESKWTHDEIRGQIIPKSYKTLRLRNSDLWI